MRIPTAVAFLDAVTGHIESTQTSSADRPIRLATVDPAYDPFALWPDPVPPARVTFDGETTLSGKAYPVASGVIPRPGQRVWLVPIGTTYLISGAVNSQTPQGFWQEADGTESGVEFGGGSYFDTTDGLFLETDATVAGDLQSARFYHAARALRIPEIQPGVTNVSMAAATSTTVAVTFPVAWPSGTTVIVPSMAIVSGANVTNYFNARPFNVTNTGFTIFVTRTDAARAADTWTNVPVHWVAYALPATF